MAGSYCQCRDKHSDGPYPACCLVLMKLESEFEALNRDFIEAKLEIFMLHLGPEKCREAFKKAFPEVKPEVPPNAGEPGD